MTPDDSAAEFGNEGSSASAGSQEGTDVGDFEDEFDGEFADEFAVDDGDVTAVYPRTRKRTSAGAMLGAAMLGLREVLYGKVSEDEVIEIEVSGDPPNIDIDGLDELIDEQHRMQGPPLDEIRARGRMSTRRPSRRSADG